MRSLAFASILISVTIPALSRADTQITLDLPPSSQAAARSGRPDTRRDTTPTGSGARQSAPLPDRRGTPPRSRNEKIIGRLGVTERSLSIRERRSTRSREMASVKPGTYLALTAEAGSWFGVLMADRSTGWILQRGVKVLDYEVLSPQSPDRHQYAGSRPSVNTALLNAGQQAILREAYRFLGVPYKWGGTSASGLDCSAFVQHCFHTLGIGLPRTAHEQAQVGLAITGEQLQAADRLYFASRDGRITHTGIYIGDGYFIHSSSRTGGVSISRLSDPLYRRMYAGARR